ncbi:hypothetical protein [Sulfitobacter sp.]|uniref:hypothetical protein n=1 Tax=Sulfitobacter sp. TaxID=1903071 RepID=UPI003299FD10
MLTIVILLGAAVVVFLLYTRSTGGPLRIANPITDPDIRAAAKRLEFTPSSGADPIASLHSADLCITAMATAFAAMDANSKADTALRTAAFEKRLDLDPQQARDAATLAPWLISQGGGATPAFERLAKRLKQLDHGPCFDKLMRVLGDVTAAGTKGMPSAAQADAMGALARIFRTA